MGDYYKNRIAKPRLRQTLDRMARGECLACGASGVPNEVTCPACGYTRHDPPAPAPQPAGDVWRHKDGSPHSVDARGGCPTCLKLRYAAQRNSEKH